MLKSLTTRFLGLLVLVLLLAACSPAEETTAPAVQPVEQEGEATAGKPQLIEFYADW